MKDIAFVFSLRKRFQQVFQAFATFISEAMTEQTREEEKVNIFRTQ